MRQVINVTKKGKIIISILCLIIAMLIVLIVTSTSERFVYFFNNKYDQRHIDIKDYYFGFYGNAEHEEHIHYYMGNIDVAHVRFVEKKNNPLDNRGAVYYFEVIEWINKDPEYAECDDYIMAKHYTEWYNDKKLGIVSPKYPGKYKSEMELIESITGVKFEKGEEYLVNMKDWYAFGINEIVCLSDLDKSTFLLEDDDCFERYGITAEMSPDEIVTRLKELIAEEKVNK